MPRPTQIFPFLILLIATVPAIAHAASPQDASVSCLSSLPAGQSDVLQSRTLPGGKIEFYGRYKMWVPSGNYDCRVRQIVFGIGRLANDLPQGTPNGPKLTFVVQHGIFHCPAKDMKVDYNFTIADDGTGHVAYTVDAQALKAKSGIYYAKISVIGSPPTP